MYIFTYLLRTFVFVQSTEMYAAYIAVIIVIISLKCKYFGIFEVYVYYILVDVGQLSEQYFNFIYYHQ